MNKYLLKAFEANKYDRQRTNVHNYVQSIRGALEGQGYSGDQVTITFERGIVPNEADWAIVVIENEDKQQCGVMVFRWVSPWTPSNRPETLGNYECLTYWEFPNNITKTQLIYELKKINELIKNKMEGWPSGKA